MGPCGALWTVLVLLKGLKGQTSSTPPGLPSVLRNFQEEQVWGLKGRGESQPGSKCKEQGGPWWPGKAPSREPSLASDPPTEIPDFQQKRSLDSWTGLPGPAVPSYNPG